ncbi:hypothetical protein PR202_ga12516 [Eleusine coracana subsp. coracana]|uniref:Uncharacterized protein n=1 Tax=Eleusine coracana subsp. coracana TaxID=191504 RepID=A0AAV5CBY3_ELECO|nr:hypothetical protein PR202_ga12516 [Eleusine coracana subsp. coracana]
MPRRKTIAAAVVRERPRSRVSRAGPCLHSVRQNSPLWSPRARLWSLVPGVAELPRIFGRCGCCNNRKSGSPPSSDAGPSAPALVYSARSSAAFSTDLVCFARLATSWKHTTCRPR